ncbi:MAG: hypothetical protein DMG12_04605, partial [Acidobacteria bacterium]
QAVGSTEAVVDAHAVLVDILGQRIHWGKIIRRCQSRAWRRKRTAIKYLPRDRIYAAWQNDIAWKSRLSTLGISHRHGCCREVGYYRPIL